MKRATWCTRAIWPRGPSASSDASRPMDSEGPKEHVARVIRGAFGFNKETGAIVLQAAIPEGSKVMLHHRTVEHVLSGTETMAGDLAQKLQGRSPWLSLGSNAAHGRIRSWARPTPSKSTCSCAAPSPPKSLGLA